MSAGNKVAVLQFERWLRGGEIKIEADKWYKSCKPHESPSLFLIPPQPPVYLRGSIMSPLKRVHANRTVLNKTSTARLGQQLRAPFPRLTSWLWADCCFYRPLPPGPQQYLVNSRHWRRAGPQTIYPIQGSSLPGSETFRFRVASAERCVFRNKIRSATLSSGRWRQFLFTVWSIWLAPVSAYWVS